MGGRLFAGLGVDHALPLRSVLFSAAAYVERFTGPFVSTDWAVELGLRHQVTPQIVVDGGVARRLVGVAPSTSVTLGLASHNWVFRRRYPAVDRLLNAFDYGHGRLYETLLRHDATASQRLETREFAFITTKLLRTPPPVPLDEHAIAPGYTTLVPEVSAMFEWSHVLHRQLYDVLADERLSEAARDAQVAEVLRYYQSRRDLAFSASPESMALMEGQSYSLAFRRRAPKYNGLLWSYHWLQMAVYDALLAGETPAARARNVAASVARFWALLDAAPAHVPRTMPLSAAIAPRFSARYPEAAIIFDNVHALHDVVADILATPGLSDGEKRATILAAAAAYRDATTAVTSRDEWREMALGMGIDATGGPAPVQPR